MTDLVKRLRYLAKDTEAYESNAMSEAADEIERLLENARQDAMWMRACLQWCEIKDCAPSSADLIVARQMLEWKEKKDD